MGRTVRMRSWSKSRSNKAGSTPNLKRGGATPRLVSKRPLRTTPAIQKNLQRIAMEGGRGRGDNNKGKRRTGSNDSANFSALNISGLSPSKYSTPLAKKVPTSKANSTAQLTAPPLTPKIMLHPFSPRGFSDQPITIDLSSPGGVREVKFDFPGGGVMTRAKRQRSLEGNNAKEKAESSLEDGEIKDNSVTFIREVPNVSMPQVKMASPLKPKRMDNKKRRLHMPKGIMTNAFNNAKQHAAKLMKKRVWGATRRDSGAPPSNLPPPTYSRPSFQPMATPDFNFAAPQVPGSVFEFRGSQNRLVPPPPRPTMGTRQLSATRAYSSSAMSNTGISNYFTTSSATETPSTGLRPIIIDGSNVAMAHGDVTRGRGNFSPRGIDMVVEFFKRRGHGEIKAFVPQHRLKAGQSMDRHILEKLNNQGYL